MKFYKIEINGAYCGEWTEEYIKTPFNSIEDLEEFIEELCDEWSMEWWDEQAQDDYEGDQSEYRANFIWYYSEMEEKEFPKSKYYYVNECNKWVGKEKRDVI